MSRDRITICLLVAALAACGGTKKEIQTAKHSLYDADFATVFTAALDATRELYPNLNDSPGPGKIATAWHQVVFGNTADDSDMQTSMTVPGAIGNPAIGGSPTGAVSPAAGTAGMPTQLVSKRYFVRFEISVIGGRPWKVKVVGHASEWDPGAAMPVEMHGANRPAWLDPRIEQLEVAIYRRIKKYARPMKDEEDKPVTDELPKTDPGRFPNVPQAAAKRLAELLDALARRSYDAIRPQLADDVVWSLGGGSGADAAMAMWQADPSQFDAMAAVVAGGCAAAGTAKVTCPGGAPVAGKFQLVIEPRGPEWKVTSFVKSE